MIIHSPIISGSLTFADGATISFPPTSVYSGSFSGSYQGDTFAGGTFTGDGSSLTFGGTNIVSGSAQVEFNEVNNNPFSQSASSVTVDKHIIPALSNLTLGTLENPFKDVYISSASLYIDGTQVISSNTNELTITTDTNQSLKLVETGADTVQIQTENGDITFTSTGTGNIELDAPIQIVAGNQIISSDGNAIQFGEDLSITGNVTVTGTVDGVDVAGLKSDFDTLEGKTLISGAAQLDGENVDLNIISGSTARISTNFLSEGDTYLGSAGNNSVIYPTGQFAGDLVPISTGLHFLGSSDNPWDIIYVDQINSPFPIISASEQISIDQTSGDLTSLGTVTQGSVTAILPSGTVSGSSQISADQTTGWAADVKTQLNSNTVISGSSQVFSDISGDVLIASNGVATIQANSVALGTDTTGNYVGTLTAGTGITSTGATSGEGIAHSLSVDYGSTAGTAVEGDTSITFAGTSNEITIDGGSSITLGSGGTVTIGLADTITGNRTFSNNVTVTGNLTVNGTTTTVNSNTVNIGDNILVLNSDETGTPSQNGGLEIERGTSTNSSLIWDESSDSWKAGLAAAEVELVTISGTQTLTNKTIDGSQLVNSSVTLAKMAANSVDSDQYVDGSIDRVHLAADIVDGTKIADDAINSEHIVDGAVDNVHLANSSITINGTGVSLGGTRTLVTDDIAEDGSPTNLWFTTARARDAFSAGTGVSISSGQISIGQAVGTSSTVQFGKVGVGTAADATYELKVSGDIGATGDIVAYISSDERLKDNIELISNPIEKVQSLRGVTWEWNDNASEAAKQSPNVGVIAQEVEKVLPQLVHDRENGYKGVDYAKLTGLLIEAIKDQQKQIDDLKSKLG